MRRLTILAAVSVAGWPCVAIAQNATTRPDPRTITVPDLSGSGDPAVVSNGWKYFLFQKQGVSYAEAFDDFADCARFIPSGSWGSVSLNRFVPWDSRPGRKAVNSGQPYGIVGSVIGSMIEGTMVRRDRQATMRRCMEPRGYVRYGVAEAVWTGVNALPQDQAIAVQAKIASSPSFGGKVPVK